MASDAITDTGATRDITGESHCATTYLTYSRRDKCRLGPASEKQLLVANNASSAAHALVMWITKEFSVPKGSQPQDACYNHYRANPGKDLVAYVDDAGVYVKGFFDDDDSEWKEQPIQLDQLREERVTAVACVNDRVVVGTSVGQVHTYGVGKDGKFTTKVEGGVKWIRRWRQFLTICTEKGVSVLYFDDDATRRPQPSVKWTAEEHKADVWDANTLLGPKLVIIFQSREMAWTSQKLIPVKMKQETGARGDARASAASGAKTGAKASSKWQVKNLFACQTELTIWDFTAGGYALLGKRGSNIVQFWDIGNTQYLNEDEVSAHKVGIMDSGPYITIMDELGVRYGGWVAGEQYEHSASPNNSPISAKGAALALRTFRHGVVYVRPGSHGAPVVVANVNHRLKKPKTRVPPTESGPNGKRNNEEGNCGVPRRGCGTTAQ